MNPTIDLFADNGNLWLTIGNIMYTIEVSMCVYLSSPIRFRNLTAGADD
jgi:hypothetical protein